MTLNITILSKGAIYQGADLRLVDLMPGSDGLRRVRTDSAPKVVHLLYGSWFGCATYCGIGWWNNRSVSDYLAEWLAQLGSNPSFDEVADGITSQGSAWIRDVQKECQRFQPHTFTLAGFEDGSSKCAIVSNARTPSMPTASSDRQGLGCLRIGPGRTHVLVTGQPNAVRKADRKALKRLVADSADPARVRFQLARVIARAASSTAGRATISSSSFCYSLHADRSGHGKLYGPVAGRFLPIQVMSGQNITALVSKLFNTSAAIVRQSASASSGGAAPAPVNASCDIRLTESLGGISVFEHGGPDGRRLTPSAMNSAGAIVGQGSPPSGGRREAAVLEPDRPLVLLGTLGGPVSSALDISSSGVVVGFALDGQNRSRAFRWMRGDSRLIDLEANEAESSSAYAVNDAGVIVGSLQNGLDERAFIWTPERGVQRLRGLEDEWSRALRINHEGWVVGIRGVPGRTTGFVWSLSDGVRQILAPGDRPFHPAGLNSSGCIVGEADDARGSRKGILWHPTDGASELPIPAAHHPIAIDDDGTVVGFSQDGPWVRPWMLRRGTDFLELPTAVSHHVAPKAIRDGVVVGSARTEDAQHMHLLVWRAPAAAQV